MPLGSSSNSSQQGTKHSAKHSCDLSWCWWSWATWCYELLHVAANHARCSPCISLTTGDLKSFWTSRTWTGSSIFTMLVMEKLNPNRWHSLAQFEGEEQVMSISETPPDASLDDGDLPLPRHRPSIKSCWSFTTKTMAMWLRSCMARSEWFGVLRQTKVHLLNLKSHMYASQRLYKRFQLITYQFAVADKYRYYSYLGMPISYQLKYISKAWRRRATTWHVTILSCIFLSLPNWLVPKYSQILLKSWTEDLCDNSRPSIFSPESQPEPPSLQQHLHQLMLHLLVEHRWASSAISISTSIKGTVFSHKTPKHSMPCAWTPWP